MPNAAPDRIETIITEEAGIRLLRARSAPLVIAFLYSVFRTDSVSEVSYDEFCLKLEGFLSEHVSEESAMEDDLALDDSSIVFQDLSSRVRSYAEDWFSEKKRYIYRYYNQNKEEMIRPSPSIIRLFAYFDSIMEADMITTESSFNYILSQLRNLSVNMKENPEERIRELEEKIREAEAEIAQIKETGSVRTYDRRKVTEYLTDLRRRSRDMLGEFAQVEENFRDIMTEIARKQASDDLSSRKVLSYSLSLHRELYNSPQGQSFDGFWSYMSQSREDEITNLGEDIISSLHENGIDYDASFLLSLRKTLYAAGSRIVNRNHMLTERMSRVLVQSGRSDRKGLEKLFGEIKAKGASLLLSGMVPSSGEFMETDDLKPSLSFPLSRTLQTRSEVRTSSSIAFDEGGTSAQSILSLRNEFSVDEKTLWDNVMDFARAKGGKSFTLQELTDSFPVTKGLEEIVAYISVLRDKAKDVIFSEEETQLITYSWMNGRRYGVTLPKVTIELW